MSAQTKMTSHEFEIPFDGESLQAAQVKARATLGDDAVMLRAVKIERAPGLFSQGAAKVKFQVFAVAASHLNSKPATSPEPAATTPAAADVPTPTSAPTQVPVPSSDTPAATVPAADVAAPSTSDVQVAAPAAEPPPSAPAAEPTVKLPSATPIPVRSRASMFQANVDAAAATPTPPAAPADDPNDRLASEETTAAALDALFSSDLAAQFPPLDDVSLASLTAQALAMIRTDDDTEAGTDQSADPSTDTVTSETTSDSDPGDVSDSAADTTPAAELAQLTYKRPTLRPRPAASVLAAVEDDTPRPTATVLSGAELAARAAARFTPEPAAAPADAADDAADAPEAEPALTAEPAVAEQRLFPPHPRPATAATPPTLMAGRTAPVASAPADVPAAPEMTEPLATAVSSAAVLEPATEQAEDNTPAAEPDNSQPATDADTAEPAVRDMASAFGTAPHSTTAAITPDVVLNRAATDRTTTDLPNWEQLNISNLADAAAQPWRRMSATVHLSTEPAAPPTATPAWPVLQDAFAAAGVSTPADLLAAVDMCDQLVRFAPLPALRTDDILVIVAPADLLPAALTAAAGTTAVLSVGCTLSGAEPVSATRLLARLDDIRAEGSQVTVAVATDGLNVTDLAAIADTARQNLTGPRLVALPADAPDARVGAVIGAFAATHLALFGVRDTSDPFRLSQLGVPVAYLDGRPASGALAALLVLAGAATSNGWFS
jgi:hypothetical protein